jgi:hypothetical protein
MNLQNWLGEFCKLHEKAYSGSLTSEERNKYLAARNELARVLLKAQQSGLQPGQTARRSLRVAVALPVTLEMGSGKLSTLTRDVSSGGFSTTLAVAPVTGVVVPFSLRLSRGTPPIEGNARLVAIDSSGTTRRGGFAYQDLPAEAVERIELTVFDSVVAQLTRST